MTSTTARLGAPSLGSVRQEARVLHDPDRHGRQCAGSRRAVPAAGGAVLAHEEAHIASDESGAGEFFTFGAQARHDSAARRAS